MFALHIAINMWKIISVKGGKIYDDALFYMSLHGIRNLNIKYDITLN